MSAAVTIAPIFMVIALGWAARQCGFFPEPFIVAANRLVYYLAIPAMVFRSIAGASLKGGFDFRVPALTLAILLAAFFSAWAWAAATGIERRRRGAFLQCSVHGNLGYVALAVAFYALGREGLARAALIAGFVMILQNLLAVTALQIHGPNRGGRIGAALKKIFANPVIIAAGAGIAFSLWELSIPRVVDRSLGIVGDLALPMALMIIGAALSFRKMQHRPLEVLSACLFKLAIMPAAALLVFDLLRVPVQDGVPALILLAAPTATVSYVMSREMHGDADFAGVVISVSTLLSAGTYVLWLQMAV